MVEAVQVASIVLLVFSVPRLLNTGGAERGSAWEDARTPQLPDVYVIVLDMHDATAWLLAEYGLDQSRFEDSLRALGFFIPRTTRAN